MKKNYVTPQLEVLKLVTAAAFMQLATSPTGSITQSPGGGSSIGGGSHKMPGYIFKY